MLFAVALSALLLAQHSTIHAQWANHPPPAAALPDDSDGQEYLADVIQIDGSRKRIVYYRDKSGVIIPPPVVEGKLVDGSPAPEHRLRALIAQTKILVRYDKIAQMALAMVGDKDLIRDANDFSKSFLKSVESGKRVTRQELNDFLFHYFIGLETGWKGDGQLNLGRFLALGQMGMSESEFEELRRDAEIRAKREWRSKTGALN